VYMQRLRGPDPIQIEWLEDLVFGDVDTESGRPFATGV
jgi:hypothetical protein